MARLPKKTTRGKKPASPPKANKQVTHKASKPEVLSKLDNKKSAIGIVSVEHSGPIPHPAILQGYEDILPGSAERLFKVFEKMPIAATSSKNIWPKPSVRKCIGPVLFVF
jgi:hypothetical protein